jgi:F0F1-type ATP synthase membrane subunit b/b'
MDIQHLVDRLEDLIDEGRHMPFSKFTMIDEERALEIIDQMRISIPEEIEKAARILAQRDRVLAQANEEAARILQQARAKGESMLEQDVSVQAAQNHAANVIEEARQQASRIMADADNYVLQVLGSLEQQLQRNLNTVRNGINEVNKPGQPAQAVEPPPQGAAIPSANVPHSVEAAQPHQRSLGISLRRGKANDQQQ